MILSNGTSLIAEEWNVRTHDQPNDVDNNSQDVGSNDTKHLIGGCMHMRRLVLITTNKFMMMIMQLNDSAQRTKAVVQPPWAWRMLVVEPS